MPDAEPIGVKVNTSEMSKPQVERPVFQEKPKSEKSWTEKGKQWLAGLKEKLSRNGQKEVLEEISDAPTHEKELLTTEESVEQVQIQENTSQRDKSSREDVDDVVESPTVPVTTQEPMSTETQPDPEEPGEVGRDEGSAPETEAQQELKEVAHPVSFPRTELLSDELTEEVIAQSVDEYITWRKEHEDKEGVLEPDRAKVIVHATSATNGINIAQEGSLNSVYSIMTKDEEPRLDRMGGGKSKHVASAAEGLIRTDLELQKGLLENKEDFLQYTPWADEDLKNAYRQVLEEAEDIDGLEKGIRVIINDGAERGVFSNYRKQLYGSDGKTPWLYMANMLPKEKRREIVDKSGAEKYVSFTLGHAVEGYTPDGKDPSTQAAVILDTSSYGKDKYYSGGGTNNFQQMPDRWWQEAARIIEEEGSSIHVSEYYNDNRGVLETSILDDENNGTEIEIGKNSVVLLPKSSQGELASLTEGAIFFDDEKFRNVDEALGWLVTTPEGKKLHEEKKKEKEKKQEEEENNDKDGNV